VSMNQQPPKSAQEIIKLKRPRSVAVYDDYVDAAHAVDYLADRQFPVATLAIVGTDLKSVERVTGSMTWGKVLLSGFLQGSTWAGMFAILMWLLQPGMSLLNLLAMGLLGFGLVGMAMSALQYRMRGRDRDYTSTTAIIATHYEVLAEAEYADKARSLLSGGSAQTREVQPQPQAQSVTPPQQVDLNKLPPPAWPTSASPAAPGQTAGPGQAPASGQAAAAPAQQPAASSPGASNMSYGQYWSEGDAPGIGDVPKRFGGPAQPAVSEKPEGADHKPESADQKPEGADQADQGDAPKRVGGAAQPEESEKHQGPEQGSAQPPRRGDSAGPSGD